MSVETNVYQLFETLCFQLESVTEHELRYIFSLVYQVLSRVQGQDLTSSKVESECISEFYSSDEDGVPVQLLVRKISFTTEVKLALRLDQEPLNSEFASESLSHSQSGEKEDQDDVENEKDFINQ